ncbi:MAG TPA: hypothetical protein VKU41_18745, partial [Polyangiaceae bacterium]|nr:hypothetical protein [Polyangiaceae bacterium]
ALTETRTREAEAKRLEVNAAAHEAVEEVAAAAAAGTLDELERQLDDADVNSAADVPPRGDESDADTPDAETTSEGDGPASDAPGWDEPDDEDLEDEDLEDELWDEQEAEGLDRDNTAEDDGESETPIESSDERVPVGAVRGAIDYECAHCHAKPGEPCVTVGGKPIVSLPHMPRLNAAGFKEWSSDDDAAIHAVNERYTDAVLVKVFGRVDPDLRARAKKARSIDMDARWVQEALRAAPIATTPAEPSLGEAVA